MKPDHLTVTEKDNITNANLIRDVLRVIYFLMGASYMPEKFSKAWKVQKRKKTDDFVMLNPDQVVKCLKIGFDEEISIELAKGILESAYSCGLVERSINKSGVSSYCIAKPDRPFRP